MKKIINYIGLTVIAATFAACNESYLNQVPANAVISDKAVTNYTEAQTALIGIYDGLQNKAYYGADMIVSGEVRGDYMQATASTKRSSSFYEMAYNAQISPNVWEYPYKVLRRANNLELAIENGQASAGSTKDALDVLRGEVLALRALTLFDLVRVYGNPFTLDAGASKGVPIETKPSLPDAQPGRSSVADVYTQVVSDLTLAVDLLKTSTARTSNNGYINLWGAKTLLARVYLYQGKNAEALALAKDVIANSPYKLLTNAGYVGAWADGGNNTEMIFQVIQTKNDNADRESISYLFNETGYEDIIVSKKLVDIMVANPSDVRNGVMIASKKPTNIATYGSSNVWLNKFPGIGGDPRVNSIPVIRLSETYLIAAEAAVKIGGASLNDASLYLNAIASRNPSLGTVAPTLSAVMDQRGIELVGEGHRFYDLMRNNMESDRTIRWPYVFSAPTSMKFDNKYFRAILPIPPVEIDANVTLKSQQNEGYF